MQVSAEEPSSDLVPTAAVGRWPFSFSLFSTIQTSQHPQHRHSHRQSTPCVPWFPQSQQLWVSCANSIFFLRLALKNLLWHFYLSNFLAILIQKTKKSVFIEQESSVMSYLLCNVKDTITLIKQKHRLIR